MSSMLEEAIGLAGLGYRVHPLWPIADGSCACTGCSSPGKHPRKSDWPAKATDNKAIVNLWWSQHPRDGIGIATGRGMVVIDLDGDEGKDSWASTYGDTTATGLVASTGGGGLHLYYRSSEPVANSVRKLGPGIDVRGDGGYVVAPPSVHKSGTNYDWLSQGDPAPLPQIVLDRLNEQEAATAWQSDWTGHTDTDLVVWPFGMVNEGDGRNHRMASFVGKLLHSGLPPEEIYNVARQVNSQYCLPPLRERELGTILHSIVRREEAKRRLMGQAMPWDTDTSPVTRKTGKFRLVKTSTLEYMPVEWLWRKRVATGKITILDGDPGTGKSGLTVDIAARVSKGLPWPDGQPACEAGDVILINGEDDPNDTIGPRLVAAGADCDRVHVVHGEAHLLPRLPDTLGDLEDLIVSVGAKLLVIDPLMAFLSTTINSNSDQEVRRALTPLAAMASRTHCAVLVVRHLNKRSDVGALARGGGSMGVIGSARLGFLVTTDKKQKGRAILTPTKSNISALADSRAYHKRSNDNGILYLEWEPDPIDIDADDALAQDDDSVAKLAAVKYLSEALEGGSVGLDKFDATASSMGISKVALAHAKIKAGVEIKTLGGIRMIGIRGHDEWK